MPRLNLGSPRRRRAATPLAVLAALLAIPSAGLTAQQGIVFAGPPEPGAFGTGARIRLTTTTRPSDRMIGWVEEVRADTLVVAGTRLGPLASVPLSSIQRLEVNTKFDTWERGASKGALIGGLLGAVIGLVIGAASEEDCTSGQLFCFKGLATLGGAMVGGLAGGLVGGFAGASSTKDQWTDVPVGEIRARRPDASLTIRLAIRPW